MSKVFVLAAVVLNLAGLFVWTASAHAEATRYKLRGRQAIASYYSFDGCDLMSLQVLGAESFQKAEAGAPVRARVGQVFGYFESYCGAPSYGWIEFSATSATQVESNLSAASVQLAGTGLRTTCEWDPNLFYYVCSSESVGVAGLVSWSATESVERMSSVYSYSNGNLSYRYRSSGNTRQAAVSGEVSIGDESYSLSDLGQISMSNQSELYVSHP